MRRLRTTDVLRGLLVLACAAGSALITASSVVYFDGEELAPFIIEKLPLPLEWLWLGALKVHVVAAALALPGCLALSVHTLFKKAPRVHRWLGRVTGVVTVFALVPSGLYLSLFAKGGVVSTLGFMLSGLIVLGAMVQGVRWARAKRFEDHRRAVTHVLAQMSVAVTSRSLLVVFDALSVEEGLAYVISLWGPVLLSALAVELMLPRPFIRSFINRRSHGSSSGAAHALVARHAALRSTP